MASPELLTIFNKLKVWLKTNLEIIILTFLYLNKIKILLKLPFYSAIYPHSQSPNYSALNTPSLRSTLHLLPVIHEISNPTSTQFLASNSSILSSFLASVTSLWYQNYQSTACSLSLCFPSFMHSSIPLVCLKGRRYLKRDQLSPRKKPKLLGYEIFWCQSPSISHGEADPFVPG